MSNNAHALTRLLLAERPSLLRLVQRIVGDPAGAEDVTQSLWLRIQRIGDDPPIAQKRAYLFRLATNLAVDHLRRDRSDNDLFQRGAVPDDVADQAPLADKALLDRETLDRLRDSIDELSPRCRDILYLRRIEGLSASAIASRLGISRQMVTRYIGQAMAHCLDRLDEDDER